MCEEEVEVAIGELAAIEQAVEIELEAELKLERAEEIEGAVEKKTAKKSTKCKCDRCKNYEEPNVYERALISMQPVRNPYPSHDITTLQRLLTRNYEFVKEQAAVPGLNAVVIYGAIDRASMELSWYPGPDDDEAFCAWIGPIIAREAERQVLYDKMQEHKLGIYWAISGVTKYCADLGADLGDPYKGRWSETVREIAADVGIRLWADPWQFDTPSYVKNAAKHPDRKPASLFTRLCKFAYWAARRWKTDQIRQRNNELWGANHTVYAADYEEEEDKRSLLVPGTSQPNLKPNVLGASRWNDAEYQPADNSYDLPFDEAGFTSRRGEDFSAPAA